MGIKKIFIANKENNNIIQDYLYYYKTKKPDCSENTIRSKKQALTKLADFLEHNTKHKSLVKASEKEMLDFFNNPKYVPRGSWNLIGINIIPFYRRLYNLDKHTRPDNMKWFETTSDRAKKRNIDPHRKDKLLITTEEFNKIMEYSNDFYGQNKAIWETYYLSGFRPEELTSMNIEDVREDKDNVIWISCPKSKTYPREIPLPEYPENLIRYIGNHPHKNIKKEPLWFAMKGSTKFERLAMQSIRERFRKMREKLKLKPTLNIKSFRKSRATIFFSSENPKINNDTNIGKYFGWSPSTVIYRREEYNLTNKEDLKKAICKKPKKSLYYDTIKSNLEKIQNEYEPIIKNQQKEIDDLKNKLIELKEDYKKLSEEAFKNFLSTIYEHEGKKGIEIVEKIIGIAKKELK